MPKTNESHPSTSHERALTPPEDTTDSRWRGLYRAGGAAGLVMAALILVQVSIWVAWSPPAFEGPALPWFELLRDNRLLGLLSLDLLYLLDSALLVVMYLAPYVVLTAGCVDTDLSSGRRNQDQSDRLISGGAHKHHAMQVNNTETRCNGSLLLMDIEVNSLSTEQPLKQPL